MRRLLLAMVVVIVTCAPFLGNARAAPQTEALTFDRPAVVLTTTDLDNEDYTGYRLESAEPFDRASDAAYVSSSQNLDPNQIAQEFSDLGEQGSYFTTFNLRNDPNDRTSPPQRSIQTGAYLFADATSAGAGLALITNTSNTGNATDIDTTGQKLGDESVLTMYVLQKDPVYGIPLTQLRLNIRAGRMVLEISTFDYEAGTAGTPNYTADEVTHLEALGQQMVQRANDALAGKSPGLASLLLPLDATPAKPPYILYTLLNGDPIQESDESDQAVRDRVSGQLDRGTVSVLFNEEQLVQSADGATNGIWFYNGIIQFENAGKATAYLNGLAARMSQGSATKVEKADVPDLGDETLALSITRTTDNGGDTHVNELYIRTGAIVAALYIQADPPAPDSPVVSFDALEKLGAAQADCLDSGACSAAVSVPDEVAALIGGAAPSTPTGKPQLPDLSASSNIPTDAELLARVQTFDNLSREHTDGPVKYDQIPPVGGMHSPVLQDCGFYSKPVGNEHAVHSLEHGAVWITYDPDLPAADIAKLEALVKGNTYLLISPYKGLPSPVVASAWGVQLQLDGVDDPYLIAFINYYEQGPQTPEPGAPCSGGTDATE